MAERTDKKMDAAITFVLTSEDKEQIKKLAQAENRSASNWIRTVIEAELRRRQAQGQPHNDETNRQSSRRK